MSKPKPILHTVDGVAGVRKSPRVYTHAVVVEFDARAAAEQAAAWSAESARGNWDFQQSIAAKGYRRAIGVFTTYPGSDEADAKREREARDFMDANPYRDVYVAESARVARERDRLADHARYVSSWHQTHAAALKELNRITKSGLPMHRAEVHATIRHV